MLKNLSIIITGLCILISFHITLQHKMNNSRTANAQELEAISTTNADQLQQIAVLNVGPQSDIFWSPHQNDSLLASVGVAGVWMYNPADLSQHPLLLPSYDDISTSVAFHPNRPVMAVGTVGAIENDRYLSKVVFWDLATKAQLRTVEIEAGPITSLSFSPDGQLLIIGDTRGGVKLFDLNSDQLVVLPQEVATIAAQPALFRTESNHLIFSTRSSVEIWNWRDQTQIASLNTGPITDFSVSADDQVLAVLAGTKIQIWNLNSLEQVALFESEFQLQDARLVPGQMELLLIRNQGDLYSWNYLSDELTRVDIYQPVRSIALDSSGDRVAILLDDNTLEVRRLFDGQVLSSAEGYLQNNIISTLQFVDSGSFLVSSWYNRGLQGGITIRRWHLPNSIETSVTHYPNQDIDVSALDPSGKFAAFVRDSRFVEILDLESGNSIGNFEAGMEEISSLALYQDTEGSLLLAAGSYIDDLHIWDISDLKLVTILPTQARNQLSIFPDHHLLASGYLQLWNLQTNNLVFSETLPTFPDVRPLAINPARKLVATLDTSGHIALWNYETLEKIQTLEANESLITALAFNDSHELLIGGTQNGKILVWDLTTGATILSLAAHPPELGTIQHILFNPDGTFIVTGSQDATVRLWGIYSN